MTPALEALERVEAVINDTAPSLMVPIVADLAAVKAALTEGAEAIGVLRAWGEAMETDDRVRGFESPATYSERCASENAEHKAREAACGAARRLAQKAGE